MSTGNIKTIHSVVAAFKLIDDFTGKVITDSITTFFVNNQRVLPIRKADGIYVLTNLHIDNANIIIQSPNYCPYVIKEFMQPHSTKNAKIISIRLQPGVNYPLKNGTTAYSAEFACASGEPSIGTKIQIFAPFCSDSIKFKAIKAINGLNAIIITNPKGFDFTGLTLVSPAKKPGSAPIIFNVISKIDNMTFEVAQLQDKQVPLEEAIVKRVYSSYTNIHGQVLIPIDVNPNSSDSSNSNELAIELYVCPLKNSIIHKEVMIKPGSLTHFKEELYI